MKKQIISKSLNKNINFLKKIVHLKPNTRKQLLNDENLNSDKELFNALHEISLNTLKGNLKLNQKQIKRLKPHKKTLVKFCCPKVKHSKKKRQKVISQSGKIWPILIPIVASVLGEIIAKNV
jgi:hypothetical protein